MRKTYSVIIVFIFSFYFSFAQSQLWSTCSAGGGPDSGGAIFRIDPSGSNFTSVRSFDTLNMGGTTPNGGLIQAVNGLLYGMTEDGGVIGAGIIYSYDPLNHAYSKVFDFDYYNVGGYPEGELLSAGNSVLYGMASGGGLYNRGTIFSFDPLTLNFNSIFDFYDSVGNYPLGSLIQGADGKLYGLTSEGGSNGAGVLFSYDIANSTYSILHNFTNASGAAPSGSLLSANGNLYGLTSEGGLYNDGTVFSFNTTGNVYTDLHNFNDTTGSNPYGGLIQYIDNLLYGMTFGGGASGYGTIFNFNPVDTGYADIYDFDGAHGAYPEGNLFAASNLKMYGMAHAGGSDSAGVIFSFDPSGPAYADLMDFNIANGQYPLSKFIEIFSTGIAESDGTEMIRLYPNPVSKKLTIKGRTEGIGEIDICNVLGEVIYSQSFKALNPLNDLSVDAGSLSAGLYFVHVNGTQSSWVGKFIKE